MKIKQLAYWGEGKTWDLLDKVLKETPYRVSKGTRLQDIIRLEKDERIPRDEFNFFVTSHIDFLVSKGRDAIFGIEFDGPHHSTNEDQIRRDIIKNKLCMKAQFPLLRIGYKEIEEYEKISLLDFIISRFIAWEKEIEDIKTEIGEYVRTLDTNQIESLTEGGIADPTIDPTLEFDLRHPFPGIKVAAKRLYSNHSIFTSYVMNDKKVLEIYHKAKSPIICDVGPEGRGGTLTGDCKAIVSFVVYKKTKGPMQQIEIRNGKITSPDINSLFEGKVDFGMRWTLPVVPDYCYSKSAFEYLQEKGELPYTFSGVPGVHIPDIAESFCEYLALREVEKWAEIDLG